MIDIFQATHSLIHALEALNVGPERGNAVIYLDAVAFDTLRHNLGRFAEYHVDARAQNGTVTTLTINGIKFRRRLPRQLRAEKPHA